MNKVEQIENYFQVVSYSGIELSKKYKTFLGAKNELDRIEKVKIKYDGAFELNNEALKNAIEDVTFTKLYGSVVLTEMKCGMVWIDYGNNCFALKYGEKRLITDNELMVVEILKSLYTWEIETFIKIK
jgi:hypothetical protein